MRLFIAFPIILAPEYDPMLAELHRRMANDKIVWSKSEVHHLTLRFLGKTPNGQLPLLREILKDVASKTPSFTLEINKLGVFGHTYKPEIIWLGFQEQPILKTMFEMLEKSLIEHGFTPEHGHFVPHITLGRIKQVDNKKRFWKAVENSQPTYNQLINVDKVVLFRSQLEKEGPIYTPLNQYSLITD